MTNSTQHRSWIPGIRGRAAGAALALAIMLVPAVLATGSAQAQTYTESVLHTFTGPPKRSLNGAPSGFSNDYGRAGQPPRQLISRNRHRRKRRHHTQQ